MVNHPLMNPHPLNEIREAVHSRLKVVGVCSINVVLLKNGGEAMTCGLDVLLTDIWQSRGGGLAVPGEAFLVSVFPLTTL